MASETAVLEEVKGSSVTFGSQLLKEGGVRFRLWAPAVDAVDLKIIDDDSTYRLGRVNGGWHELAVPSAAAGTKYQFLLPDGTIVPDPASRYQPQDGKGPSEVVDPSSFTWQDDPSRGLPWHEAILYELHIGTFTEEGTFLAAIDKLDPLGKAGGHRDRGHASG